MGIVTEVDLTDFATGARASGQFPVLLTQSPYVRDDPKVGNYFVQRGYIYFTAHVRGTRTSGGSFSFFSERDAKDGAELVAWVAKKVQNSNGVVGLHGNSYRGLTQMLTVAALGTGSPVKAMAASCMGAEFYPETYFASGIPTQTLNFQRVIGNSMGGDTAAAGVAIVDRASVVGCQQGARKGRLIGRMFTQLAAVSKLLAINRQPGWSILEYRSHRSRH